MGVSTTASGETTLPLACGGELSEPGVLFDWSAEVFLENNGHGWSPEQLQALASDATAAAEWLEAHR